MATDVTICECFARDGLQHEREFVATADKVAFIDLCTEAGFPRIEATSYSNPAKVPAFADGTEVLASITRKNGVYYKATCPNDRAVSRALADFEAGAGANELSLLVSATEGHTRTNLNTTRAEQWQRIALMAGMIDRPEIRKIGVISVAFGCPIDGHVPMSGVLDDIGRFAEAGVSFVALGDTTGLATPVSVGAMFREIARHYPDVTPIAHFHDSRGTAIANCWAALDAGCTWFDTAFGGVGGHPAQITYGGGYTGNVATEDLVSLFESAGINTGLDLDLVMQASRFCEKILKRELRSMVARTGFGLIKQEEDIANS